jgi:hypothetical protein
MRGLLRLGALAVVAACNARPAPAWVPPPSAPVRAAVVEVDAAPAPLVASVERRLDTLAIDDDDFYRPVLYTWTTPESIADLRVSHRLLVATANSGKFTSPFNRALAHLVSHGGPGRDVARLLTTDPALIRRRYAWPAPFATVMGLGDRSYGTALVRIDLRPTAWIGRFEPAAAQPFRFVDADGTPVAIADVIAAPERIAAIYHVRTEPSQAIPFREYIVCNEAMIASWSIATPAIRAEVDFERGLLDDLRARALEVPLADAVAPAAPGWPHHAPSPSLVERWRSALAFDNVRYRLGPPQLTEIVEALDAYDGSGPPLTVSP